MPGPRPYPGNTTRPRRAGSPLLFRGLLALASLLPVILTGQVSREPPPAFAEKLAPLLTPVAHVLKAGDGMETKGYSGMVLATEWITFVDADGRRLMARQVAYKTLTEAGASSNAEDIFSYRRNEQKFHLVTAETIQPDGTVLPVKENAILLQTPQREAEYALYDDQAEVRVIYPNVKPGSVTHAIYVIEDVTARMPGEFTRIFTWDTYWPAGLFRDVVDLPAAMADRLQVFTLGTQVPAPKREALAGEHVRLTWARDHIPAERDEVARAPASQVGPAFHVTTLTSWDKVGDWFSQMLQGRDQLSPGLAAKVDEWTKGAPSRDEILRILLAKVANDVRYTGLELGEADYRPHNCNEVWDNQYGDCKDKANLLVAFLHQKGIPARMVLVNTNHLGLVDRRVPDYRIFNHAIVALPNARGGYQFCDPTIEYARPGMLSPGDADRDVLVIKEKGGEWARTPAVNAGSLRYQFDLKLNDAGELSGWLTLAADGFYGVRQREDFRKLDPDESRRTMVRILRGFFPSANVIDVVSTTSDASADTDVVKAYFVNPGQKDERSGKQTLVFPQSTALFLDLGHEAERESTFFLHRDRIQVTCAIELPASLVPGAVPESYHVDTPTGTTRAKWQFDKNTARMELEMTVNQSALGPKEFGRFYQARQSLRAWLEKPVVLAISSTVAPAAAENAEVDLPLMPSSDGQIDLLDERYPEDGNHGLRRAALEKTIQYFPKDRVLAFRVGIRLASLDWKEDKNQPAFDRLQPLLAAYKAEVTPETFAWGEVIEALALRDLKRATEAVAILERIARDSTLSAERRATAAIDASDVLETKAPADALALLTEVAATKNPLGPSIYTRMSHLMLVLDHQPALHKCLEELVQSKRDDLDEILTRIAKDEANWNAPGDLPRRQAILTLLAELVPQPGADLQGALEAGKLHLACARIQQQLKEQLAQKPIADWYAPTQDHALKTVDDFKQAIAKAEEKVDPALCLQLSVQALVTFPTGDEFPRRLWRAASYSDWKERRADKTGDEPIYALLLDLCEQLPKDHDYYFEGRILRAEHLSRKGERRGAQAIYQEILQSPSLGKGFIVPVCKDLGLSFEKTGDLAKALETYRRMESQVAGSADAAAGLLRAVLINLHQNQPAEAERVIGVLEPATEDTLKKAVGGAQIREFIALHRSGQAGTFWAAASGWWPAWQAFAESVGNPAEGEAVVAPVISDLTELGTGMGTAIRANDRKTYFHDFNRMASAARWLPSLAPEVAGMSKWNNQLYPAKSSEFRKVCIALLRVAQPAALPGLRNRQLYLAITFIDEHQYAEALKVVAEFNATEQPDDDVSHGLRRLWALAALETKKDLAACAAAIEKELKSADFTASRAKSVGLLADLFRALGRPEEQEPLFKRELEHPAIIADANGHAALNARYQQLTGSGALAAKIKSWVKSYPVEWYDFAEPANLDDPRLRDLDRILKTPGVQFNPVELAKLRLLVAQDTGRSLDVQTKAWNDACNQLFYFQATFDQLNHFIDSVMGDAGFREECRQSLLWNALIDSADHGRKEEYARWRHHPLVAKLNPRLQSQLESTDLLVATDRTSSKSIQDLIAALTAKEIGPLDVLILQDALQDLLRRGDLAAAHAYADTVPSWRLGADVEKTKDSLQLDFSRKIRAAEALAPLHEALARRVLEQYPNLPDVLPAVYADLRRMENLPATTSELTLQACLQRIKTRQFDREGLVFWRTFLRALPSRPESDTFIVDLVRIALAEVHDDDQRADVIGFFRYSVDMDNPALLGPIESILADYRHPVEAPLTYSQIRLHEIFMAMRHGKPVDLATAFDGLDSPGLSTERTWVTLLHYTQAGDRAALKRVVDALPSEQLLDLNLLSVTIPAFDLLGMKSEADTARKIARRELRKALLMSWASSDEFASHRAFHLAELVGDPDAVPAGWIKAISTRSWDAEIRHTALLVDAWLHQNWTQVGEHVAELIKIRPTYYHYYWYQGMALHHLGKDAEAVGPLTTYVHFSKDELEYPAAVALLQKLGAPPP